jgi:hypothetical protein
MHATTSVSCYHRASIFCFDLLRCAVAFVRKLELALVVPPQLFSSRDVLFQSVCPRNIVPPPSHIKAF